MEEVCGEEKPIQYNENEKVNPFKIFCLRISIVFVEKYSINFIF